MNLFIDLDDVLFPFSLYYAEQFGHRPEDVKVKDDMWRTIATQPSFFMDMPLAPGAAAFLARFAHLNPMFVTHVPTNDFGLTFQNIADQKRFALRSRGLGGIIIPVPGHPVKVSKAHYMQNPGDVLVDDWKKNIREWEEAGGKGIIHKSFTDTTAELEWHLYSLAHPNMVVS